jgi:hypothetical protein
METQDQVRSGLSGTCLLLGGQPRSGTTLLSSILRATPGHFQAFEIHLRKPSFVVGLDGRYTRNIMKGLGLPPEEYDRVVAQATKEGLRDAMNLGAWTGPKEDVSAEELTGRETDRFAEELVARAELLRRLMARTATIAGKRSWGFKILGDMRYADVYERAFPGAMFLLLIRDPRDQALSILELNKQRLARGQRLFYEGLAEAAAGWRDAIGESRAALRRYGLRFAETRYEDLVTDTDRELDRLGGILGLDLRAGIDYRSDGFVEEHTKRFAHHDNLRNSINASSVGKWRKALSAEEQLVVRREAGALMEELGYR